MCYNYIYISDIRTVPAQLPDMVSIWCEMVRYPIRRYGLQDGTGVQGTYYYYVRIIEHTDVNVTYTIYSRVLSVSVCRIVIIVRSVILSRCGIIYNTRGKCHKIYTRRCGEEGGWARQTENK